jgi:hypothetical protein
VTEGPSREGPSDKDQIKPFHAKEVTTGQETADVLASVLKHAAAKDQAAKQKSAPKPQPIWMLPLGLMMTVFAGFLLVASPEWVVVNPIAAQAPEVAVENMETAMFMQMSEIANYVARNQTLPQTITGGDDFVYVVSGNYYTLCGTLPDGAPLCFDSRVEDPRVWAQRNIPTMTERIGG